MINKLFNKKTILSLSLFLGLAISSCQKVENPIIQPPTPGPIETVKNIDQSFDGAEHEPVEISGWNNIIIKGERPFIYRTRDKNSYATVSVYNSKDAENESWLITPMLDVENAEYKNFFFKTRADHLEGATFEVFYSKDFDGNNIETANWTKMNVKIGTSTATGYGDWTPSGTVDLKDIGNCVIAMKYSGAAGSKDGGYALDDFMFNKKGEEVTPPEEGTGTGTLADPYDIINAKANQGGKDNKIMKWTTGYVIGFIETRDGESNKGELVLGASDFVKTNIVIANKADETDLGKALIVQLSNGFIRDGLNLVDNKDKVGTKIWVEGSLEAYFAKPGIKSLNSYSLDGSTEITPPENGIIGAGTPINGSDLTNTSIDFTVWNVKKSEAIWTAKDAKAVINAYNKGETESWMISKNTVDFTSVTDARLFVTENINHFKKFEDIKVMISTDYSGSGDPSGSTWTALSVDGTRANNGENTTQFIANGTGYIAFVYNATESESCLWEVKTVKIKTKEDGGTPPNEPTGIVNGDFEKWTNDTTPEGWDITLKSGNKTVNKETSIKKEGSSSIKLDGKIYLAQNFKVESGETYEISFWYYLESGKGRFWSKFINDDGSNGDNLRGPDEYLTGNKGEWIQFKQEYTAAANTAKLHFELRSYLDGENGVVYYDDITVTKK